MIVSVRFLVFQTALLLSFLAVDMPSKAESLSLVIDQSQSSVHVDGAAVVLGGVETPPQGLGADITSYTGTMEIDLDDILTPTAIQLTGGDIAAQNSGNWLPEVGGGNVGSSFPNDADPGVAQPANYGLELDGDLFDSWLAFRELHLQGVSGSKSISNGTNFDAGISMSIIQGSSDVTVKSFLLGDFAFNLPLEDSTYPNTPAASGSYVVDAGIATLTVPIDFTVNVEDASIFPGVLISLHYTGAIVATAALAEPTGDFDNDGDVDGSDFLAWQTHFPTTADALQEDGDGDNNGTVDAADFELWKQQYGSVASGEGSLAGSNVPEPSSLLLMVGAIAFGLIRFARGTHLRLLQV